MFIVAVIGPRALSVTGLERLGKPRLDRKGATL
jgi:hypothetical protein